ncbi:MAG: PAS domain S-box protein [Candidatus Paceibacterota bacterium]
MPTKPRILEFSIKEKKEVASGTTEVTFSTEGNDFIFNPGQYIRLTILTLNQDVPKGNTRDFTISSSPDEKGVIRIAFRNSDSEFKKTLLSAPTGAKIQAQGPLGVFTLPEDVKIPVVFVAGGMGITPVLSMIRFVSANKTRHNIHIVYANSSVERAAYLEEIRLIVKNNSNLQLTEKIGRVDAEFIKDSVKYTKDTLWYLCGVPEMIFKLSVEIPKILEISDHNIRIEEYVGYEKTATNYKILPPMGPKMMEITNEEVTTDKNLVSSLLSAVGQGALIAVTDTQGTIQYINEKFIEVAKYSKEELVGQNHRILKSGFHPPEFYKELWETISLGKIWRGELKNRAKDGSVYWVDTTITPIFDDNKNIKQYLAVRFLISDKKDLEESGRVTKSLLRDVASEKEKMSTILESIGDGVFVVDRNLNIIIFNSASAQLSGFSEKEAIGQPYRKILNFVYEKDEKINDKFIKEVFRTRKIQIMNDKTNLIRKDGSKIAVSDSAAPLVDSNNDIIGAVVVFRDVTKERAVDRAKTEFVSLASHQLRTPLSAIGWNIELLLTDQVEGVSHEQIESLQEIQKANKRMVALVDALLNTSRIDMGTLIIDLEPVDFIEIANSVLEELKPTIETKQISIEKSYGNNIPKINADPKLSRIILQNFLSNAVKYTPEKGKINITIEKREGDLYVAVADTGYGIPKSQQGKIFSKLFRADNVQGKDVEGNGLGLYIVKSIIDSSGGKVWFESEENKGTTFHITLPLSGMKKKEGVKRLI